MLRWPVLGHAPAFLFDKLGFLDRCASSGSGVVAVQIGGPTLLLREPADIQYVLEERPESFQKSPKLASERGRRLSGRGVLTSHGDRHKRLRDALHPLFTRSAFSGQMETLTRTIRNATARWEHGSVHDLAAELPRLAKCMMGRLLFGADYSGAEPRLSDAFGVRKKYLQFRFDVPFFWPEWLPIPLELRYRGAMREIRDYLTCMLAGSDPESGADCLIKRMAAAGLPDAEVCDEAITLAITGYETLGEALTWTLWLAGAHPDAQAVIREEARRVLTDEIPSSDDLLRLPYTAMVLSEAMRLYPPTWLFLRRAIRDETLPSGYRVRRGDKIYLSPWVVHRDARFFRQPLGFRPEHFLAADIAERPKLAYFPFGAGPRLCLGHHLARVEGVLTIALLLRDFRLTPQNGAPVRPRPRMTLVPAGPVSVRVERCG